ncbi:MAG: hypothetical protein ACHQ2Z_10065 [Elusimicrobiota bacterium]
MSDNTRKTMTGISAWLPVASLALSAAAFSMGAPAKIARRIHRGVGIPQRFQNESAMRDEHVMFPMPASSERIQRLNVPIFLRR